MDLPRTPSPPPPPPSPAEVFEPMDLSSERPPFQVPNQSPTHHPLQDAHLDHLQDMGHERGMMRQNQVGTTILRGVPIVSLYIDTQERLCLAQISNTLLKTFSYNEIHNRRVALGITCVQCTPVQLEILRRAGAMPISSRRCGMITKREAERLVKSFLEEHAPPKLPDNFAFKVHHSCGWGCKGNFMPSRYNSSRAKCIKCTYCNLFFSPNKFIFHFHRAPDAKYRHPDAANFNSWRRHMDLDYEPVTDDLMHAWEDVKAMFNGGSRKRLVPCRSFSKSEGEKRQRLSTSNQAMPKMPPHHGFNMFPNNNTVPSMFPQQPPYGQFPIMSNNDMDNISGNGRRMSCFPDLWRPKNSMSYYNPLSLMWAKNFGLCPPGGQQSVTKQDMGRGMFRMPGMFMDMNGNETGETGEAAESSSSSGRSKSSSTEQIKRKPACRSSAFRRVGNFGQCPSLSTNMAEFNMPVFPTPSMSTFSERSDDCLETMDDDGDGDDEEDVDVDVEDARDGHSDAGRDALDAFGLQETELPSEVETNIDVLRTRQNSVHCTQAEETPVSANVTTNTHVTEPVCTTKRDHVTSFSIDSLFDTKKESSRCASITSAATHTVASSGGNSSKHDMAVKCEEEEDDEEPTNLGYILHLSKEELQNELMKLMEARENIGNVISHTAHVGSKSPEGATPGYSELSRA